MFRVNKFYMDRHGSNLLLTQHFRIGIDGYKHKHNTNILIVGGSGAGKTRTYVVPNVLECACSMVITDPKAEILRKTGNLLEQKGYEVIVFDLINPAASFCYNQFVYVHDDRKVLTLIENLIQNTTPSHSKSSDPFWEKSETALLQALMLLGWGIVQVGLSLQSHDPSQRSQGFLTLAGGLVITFAKEILDLITA